MSGDYPSDLTDREALEARARRLELLAVLVRRGDDNMAVIRGPGLDWVAPRLSRRRVVESIMYPWSSKDFRESCMLAGFDPDAELALVKARAGTAAGEQQAPEGPIAQALALAAKLRAAKARATPGPWRWWTSNSLRRLTAEDRQIGGVAHAFTSRSDGFPDIAISEEDMALIEVACNSAGETTELLERLVAMLSQKGIG